MTYKEGCRCIYIYRFKRLAPYHADPPKHFLFGIIFASFFRSIFRWIFDGFLAPFLINFSMIFASVFVLIFWSIFDTFRSGVSSFFNVLILWKSLFSKRKTKVLQFHLTLNKLNFYQNSNQNSINFRIIFSSCFMTFSASFFASNFAWIFDEKRVPKRCQNRCQNHQKSIWGGQGGDKCRFRILFGCVLRNAFLLMIFEVCKNL